MLRRPDVYPADHDRWIHPLGALVHPLWLAALGTLILNDHVLKHSSFAGAFTGKVSDVAGMIVAPILLAALLRVRSRAGVWLCAIAVGAVFSAINLSTEVAARWDALVTAIALPYHTTTDPTDLLALLALPLGLRVLIPHCKAPQRRWKKRVAWGAALVGALACTATSQPRDDNLEAQVSLLNKTHELKVLRVRTLKPDVEIDCDVVAEAPGEYFAEDDFGEPDQWELLSGQEIGLGSGPQGFYSRSEVFSGRDCTAALIQSDTVEDIVVFWGEQVPLKRFQFDPDVPKEIESDPNTVELRADYSRVPQDERKRWRARPCDQSATCTDAQRLALAEIPAAVVYSWASVADERLHHPVGWRPFDEPTQTPDACQTPGVAGALTWTALPTNSVEVRAIRRGIDGCHTFEFESSGTSAGNDDLIICAPYDALTPLGEPDPSDSSSRLEFTPGWAPGGIGFVLARLSESEPFFEEAEVQLVRGGGVLSTMSLELESTPKNGCGPVEVGCHREIPVNTTVRSTQSREFAALQPGESVSLDEGSRVVHLVRAVEVPLMRAECEDVDSRSVANQLRGQPAAYYEIVVVETADLF